VAAVSPVTAQHTVGPTTAGMVFTIEWRRELCPCGTRTATARGPEFRCDKCGSPVSIPPSAHNRIMVAWR